MPERVEYLFNAYQHGAFTYVTQLDIGNQAHDLYQAFALLAAPGGFIEKWYTPVPTDDPSWTFFGGRVDYGNTVSLTISEIGSVSDYFNKVVQISGYVSNSSLFGAPYSPSGYPIFASTSSPPLVIEGSFATYTYRYMGWGVIGYTYQLNPNVIYQPATASDPVLGVAPGVRMPAIIPRIMPEAIPAY